MSERSDSIIKTLATIDADLNTLGWDRPAQLYQLIEDEQDPTAELIGVLPTHPVADLLAGFDAGTRCPDFVLGLVATSEAYRHLSFEELIERHPEFMAKITASAARDGLLADIPKEAIRQKAKDYYMNVILEQLPSPSELPPAMRMEMRITTAVLRDGAVHKFTRTRETDQTDVVSEEIDGTEGFPTSLFMFLHGMRPDPDCDDPQTAVSDYETLQALADLPVTEER